MIEIFKVLSDETRLRIFLLITKGEVCVCEIENVLGLTQSNTSRHLNYLKRVGLVETNKKAQWVYYKVSGNFIKKNEKLYGYILDCIDKEYCYKTDCENYQLCKKKNLCDCNKEK